MVVKYSLLEAILAAALLVPSGWVSFLKESRAASDIGFCVP